jgi:hypothetical protein
MLKVTVTSTVAAWMLGAETTLEIESPEASDRVARVVRNAERGGFVMQPLQQPVPATGRTVLNGVALGAEHVEALIDGRASSAGPGVSNWL